MTVLLSHKHRGSFAYDLQVRSVTMFSGVVLVDGRPEQSSSSTDVRPSLKRLSHKKSFALAHGIISVGFL